MSGAKIGVSTHELALQTEKALGGKVPLELVLAVWHEIGNTIKQQLVQRKAVRLSSFGTFSFSVKGEPTFSLSTEFATQFKVKQRGQVALDNIPTAALNCSSVGASLGTSRDVVEKIYAKFITCVGRMLYDARDILLSIHRVAEIRMAQGEVYCEFIPDFLGAFGEPKATTGVDRFKKAAQKTSNMLTSAKLFEASIRRDREAEQQKYTGLDIGGSDESHRRQGVRAARPSSAGRSRNPILGTGLGSPSSGRPSSADRPMSAPRGDFCGRPGSAHSMSTNSSRLTPRGHGEAAYGIPGRPSQGGLTREALERHTQSQRGAPAVDRISRPREARDMRERQAEASHSANVDARLIAAKALDAGAVINKVRAKIVERGGSNGMRSIARLLAIMDDNGDKRLSRDELKYGLRDYGIDLTPTELEQVFLYFDRDGNGFIDTTEFLVGIRGEMNERRRKMVRMAFDVLDRDRSGVVDVDEILQAYDLRWHPEVRAGKLTVQEAARDFMKQWDRLEQDGRVTVEEFEDYYKELSASIDDDDYFELMIRNAWRIAGGQGAAANTANRRVLVTNKDGSQSIQTVEQELGMRGRDVDDVRARLARQGVQAERVEMHGGVEEMRAAKTGRAAPVSHRTRGAGGAAGGGPTGARPVARAGPPREAWLEGPAHPGDQSLAPNKLASPRGPHPRDRRGAEGGQRDVGRDRSGSRGADSKTFDPHEALRRLLYTPPVSLEALCSKLQVSVVEMSPRIAQGAFVKRLMTLDASLDRTQLAAMWKAVDPKNLGVVEVAALHSFLGDRFGKDKSSQRSVSVIDRVIKKILERCGENAGIKGLQRTLAIMDNSGDKRLSKDELKYGLQDYGIELNLRELDDLFTYFDRDRSGTVDITELLVGIRGDLNERRAKLVRMAFNLLDKDRSGAVSTEELLEHYNFKAHPDVVAGKKTVQEAAREFMAHWDRQNPDGVITYEEFEDYYKELSASIDDDDYFELMIRNAWRIAGGQGAAANTANRRVLVTNKDGSQSIQTVEQELGMRGRDVDDVRARLARQGVQAERVEMHGGVEEMRAAKTSRVPARNGPGGPSDRHQRPRGLASTAPAAPAAQPSQFVRHAAAMKLAAAYRGRLGRKKAEHERRKADAEQRQYWEEQQEAMRPKPREITRPKGKSYIGF